MKTEDGERLLSREDTVWLQLLAKKGGQTQHEAGARLQSIGSGLVTDKTFRLAGMFLGRGMVSDRQQG